MNIKSQIKKIHKKICCYLTKFFVDKPVYENNTAALDAEEIVGNIYITPIDNDISYLAYVVEAGSCELRPPIASYSNQCGYGIPGAFVVSNNSTLEPAFRWYDSPTDGNLLFEGSFSSYNYPISETTTVYVSEFKEMCESERIPVVMTVTPTDPIEITVENSVICIGEAAKVTAKNIATIPSKAYTYDIYINNIKVASTVIENTPVDIILPETGVFSIYAIAKSLDCSAISLPIEVTVLDLPQKPLIASGGILDICDGEELTLYVTNLEPGVSYTWKDSKNNTYYGEEIVVSPAEDTTYTVTAKNLTTDCEIESDLLSITVHPAVPAPTAYHSSHCGMMVPYATVTSNSGAATPYFKWYDAETDGNVVLEGNYDSWPTAVSTNQTWWVSEVSEFGCESPRVELTVNVLPADTVSILFNQGSENVNFGETLELEVIQDGFTNFYDYEWMVDIEGASGITNNTEYSNTITFTPNLPGTYKVKVIANDFLSGCQTFAEVTIVVDGPAPNFDFLLSEGLTWDDSGINDTASLANLFSLEGASNVNVLYVYFSEDLRRLQAYIELEDLEVFDTDTALDSARIFKVYTFAIEGIERFNMKNNSGDLSEFKTDQISSDLKHIVIENQKLTSFNMVSNLDSLSLKNNLLSNSVVNELLIAYNSIGKGSGFTLDLSGNESPTDAGVEAKHYMIFRGATIIT